MPPAATNDDPRLARYALVGDPAALEREGLFVAEGRLVVERLLDEGRFRAHSVVVTPAAAAAMGDVLARHPEVDVIVSEPDVLRQVTGFHFHRGCLALAHRPQHQMTVDMLAPASRVLALEGVTDPDNVGGLFRTALALEVEAVILSDATADPFYRKAIRTSMAATLLLPFVRAGNWLETLSSLRAKGFRIVALTPHPDAIALDEYAAAIDERIVVVVGSEGLGMTAASLALADVRVRIPVDPRADSLNVVTAASIALYTLRRRC